MIITFDGASCTGKSTLAKLVASKLGFDFMNSGMIYRAVTYQLLQNGVKATDTEKINNFVANTNTSIKVFFVAGNQRVLVNEVDCTDYVSTLEVTENVSQFSQNLKLRKLIENVQHEFAQKNNCVFEGRDLGSVVFPDADYKFYVECDMKVRAKRRLDDLLPDNPNLTLSNVKKMLEERDYRDMHREISPLIKPKNAIVVDTSYDTIDESIKKILSYIV